MASSSDCDDLADIIDRHQPDRSQDSDLPAWIQAHVSNSSKHSQSSCRTPCVHAALTPTFGAERQRFLMLSFAFTDPCKGCHSNQR
jgi:hypothetical protein